MTRDYLLAVGFGGVLLGIGVGLVVLSGGGLGGTETVAIFVNQHINFLVRQTVPRWRKKSRQIPGGRNGWRGQRNKKAKSKK